jgi:hypothetical protein
MAFLAGGLAFTADWTKRIQKNNVLRQAAIPFLSLPPVAQNLPLQMIGTIASAPVLNGTIVITSLCPVGSGCISRDYGDPGMFEDPLVQLTSAPGSVVKLDNLTVTHLTFKVFSLQSRESRILNLRYPRLGWELVQIDPAEAAVQLRPVNSLIQIENLSDEPIRFVTIRVLPVTPKWVWLLSFITLIIGFLSILASGRITPRLRHLPPNSLDSPPI